MPLTKLNLGRVLVASKGAWNPNTTYSKLDLVYYNKKMWICAKNNLKGETPTDTSSNWKPYSSGYDIDGQTLRLQSNGKTYVGIDNSTIQKNSNGQLSVPTTSSSTLGLIKTGSNITNSSGVISIPTASGSTLGVVKTGANITNSSGVISIPTASSSTLGVVKFDPYSFFLQPDDALSVPDAGVNNYGVCKATSGPTKAIAIDENGVLNVKADGQTVFIDPSTGVLSSNISASSLVYDQQDFVFEVPANTPAGEILTMSSSYSFALKTYSLVLPTIIENTNYGAVKAMLKGIEIASNKHGFSVYLSAKSIVPSSGATRITVRVLAVL